MALSERERNIAVGATAIVGVLALCTLLMLFGYVPAWMEGGYTVTVQLPTAGGLHTGGQVSLNGIDIGRIQSVKLADDSAKGVKVVAKIRDDITLPANVHVRTQSALLGGGTYFAFVLDGQTPDEQSLPKDGSASVTGYASSPFAGMAGEMRSMAQKPLEQFDQLNQRFNTLADEWTRLGQNLNQLVEPRTTAQVDTGDATGNLPTILARFDDRLKQAQITLEGLNRYLDNPQLYDQIAGIADETHTTVTQFRQDMTQLKTRYLAMADDLTSTLNHMQTLIDQARTGEGTLGQLMSNPQLYRNLNDSAQRLDAMFKQMQQLIERWKAQGIELSL